MQQIYPVPIPDITVVADFYRTPESAEAPWVFLSMVHSLDGTTSLNGASGDLGSVSDQNIFSALRSRADLILVGSGTARAERYQPLKRAGQRLAIVTASGDLPWDEPVYTHPQTVIVTTADAPSLPVEALRVGQGQVDLAQALKLLAPTVVMLEGGSTLNGQMLAAGLVDELCLTAAPLTAAGSGPRVAHFDREHLQHFVLRHVLEDDGYLFSRYAVIRP